MTDHDFEQSLSRWFAMEIDASEAAPPSLRASLSSIPDVAPAPRRLVGSRFALLAAVLVTATLLAGAIAVGTGLVELPNVPPPPPTAPPPAIVSPDPTASPGESTTQGLVAFTVSTRVPDDECSQFFHCIQTRLWVSNADGSEARDLLPDWPGSQTAIAWSEDGTSLFFTHDSEDGGSIADAVYVTDASGRRPTLVMTGEPCTGGVCGDIAISPDGRRIAFARGGDTESVIAVLVVESGEVREIEATRAGPYMASQPRWSPDGRTLVYARTDSDTARCIAAEAGALMSVGADGTDLREIVPIETCAVDPQWSPDGSAIVFWSAAYFHTEEVYGLAAHELHDVFVVRSDGTDRRRLTDDQMSSQASWTNDGRIVFARIPLDDGNGSLGFELWIMDADGGNRSQVDASDLSELSALGCLTCHYPPPGDDQIFGPEPAVWQPTR
jgi:Tol biopolymer transport system component